MNKKDTQKLDTIEATVRSLIEEFNKISGSERKLGLICGFDEDLVATCELYSPNAKFYIDSNNDYWFPSCSSSF